jgi:GntR family transcriptional regulator, transcriptional repressor for pyruvate dehydrogenase complex
MTVFEPMDRVSIAKNVISQIKRAMEEGRLRRGDQLPPGPLLAEQMQVSRASLREALKVLEVMGVLEVRRGSGTYIAERPRLPTVDPLLFLLLLQDGDAADLVEVRYMIEVGFTRLAQARLSPDDFERLERSVSDLRRSVAAGTATAEEDLAFHRIILDATGNQFVIQIGNTILELFRESIGRGVKTFPTQAVEHHEAILAALKKGGTEEIEAAVEQSYEYWRNTIAE